MVDGGSGAKHPLRSKTILGLIVAALPLLADALGLQLDDAEMQTTANSIVQLAGLALAAHGRFAAKQRLGTSPGRGAK